MAGVDHTTDAYVKINGYGYPLIRHETDEELMPGGEVITNAIEGFAPSSVAGDATVVDQQVVAALVFSDFRPGEGFKFVDEAENIGGYQYGTLDTRYPNMAVLPPRIMDLGALPAAFGVNDPMHIFVSQIYNEQLLVWGENSNSIAVRPSSGVWVNRFFASGAGGCNGVCEFGATTFFATQNAVEYSDDPGTIPIAAGMVGSFSGPVVQDGKIYVWNQVDRKMYWTSTVALAKGVAAWTGVSVLAMPAAYTGFPAKMYATRNRANGPVIHLVFYSGRIISYDTQDDFWGVFYEPGQPQNVANSRADAAVWEQDRQVYLSVSGPGGTSALALTDDTTANVSPNKRGGLPTTRRYHITSWHSSLNYLYAFGGAPRAEDAIGMGPAAIPAVPGWIKAWNGEGWHPIAEGTGTTNTTGQIRAAGYAPNQPLWITTVAGVTKLWGAYVPDLGQLPYDVDGRNYAEGTYILRSAIVDAELENVDKTARHFTVFFEQQDGTPGIPANHTAQLWASWDGGAFAQVGATMTSLDTFPQRFPLPGPETVPFTPGAQAGIVWRFMQWEIRVTKNAGATASVTPIFRGLSLGYLRSPDIYNGFQFVVDLTRERFNGFKGGLFMGRGRRELRDKLIAMAAGAGAKYHYRIEWGWADDYNAVTGFGNRAGVIPAAEIRINTRENPGTGLGQYTVTGKDVSVKAVASAAVAPG